MLMRCMQVAYAKLLGVAPLTKCRDRHHHYLHLLVETVSITSAPERPQQMDSTPIGHERAT